MSQLNLYTTKGSETKKNCFHDTTVLVTVCKPDHGA